MNPGHGLTLLPERTQLPRGRAALPAAEVARSQRGRILQAVAEEVAARGYHATSVQDVIARASVSRKAFYGLFTDKQDAFAAAHLEASEQLFDLIRTAVDAAPPADWRGRHRLGVTAYLDGLSSAPVYATSFMVELRSAGSRLLDQRDRILDRHTRGILAVAEEIERARHLRSRPSRLAVLGAVGATDELVTREIRAGRSPDLSTLLDPIVEIHLAVLTGS